MRAADGSEESVEANAVISAVGQLNRPSFPPIEGRETFDGPSFHSAQWDHSVDLHGKRVAVIGTGASAVQFIPEIAGDVAHLVVFQRTPPWMGPTPEYHDEVPAGLALALRARAVVQRVEPFLDLLEDGRRRVAGRARRSRVGAEGPLGQRDERPDARDARPRISKRSSPTDRTSSPRCVPDYPVGAKRVLRDNGVWAGALKRANVELVTESIREITSNAVVTQDGVEHAVDVIVYGTGFHASKFLMPMTVIGRDRVDLHEQWGGDARAYLGITVPGFPNLFCLYGPNTNIVINGSIVYFSECEVRYVLGCIELLLRDRLPRARRPQRRARCVQRTRRRREQEHGVGSLVGEQLVQERQRSRRSELAVHAARVLAAHLAPRPR